ncbi:MAG: hypothetical protein ACFFAE_01800 [Candidatus Hodarchaeota archaeon]
MRSNSKLLVLLFILFFFTVFYPLGDIIAAPRTNQRLIPFIGMKVDYRLTVIINKMYAFPVIANWTVTWEQYNQTTPSIFISNLTIKSLYILPFALRDHESGIIIENITSRQILYVNLTDTIFLEILYNVYFSPDQPNYSPFYINTTGINIGDHVNIYSFDMTVVSINRSHVADFGWRDVWIIQINATETNVEHFIRLLYDNTTGVLVGGSIKTRWFEGNEYDVEIFCQYTNALERHLIIIETNRILVVLVSCVPIIPSLVKIFRMKEIEGGL